MEASRHTGDAAERHGTNSMHAYRAGPTSLPSSVGDLRQRPPAARGAPNATRNSAAAGGLPPCGSGAVSRQPGSQAHARPGTRNRRLRCPPGRAAWVAVDAIAAAVRAHSIPVGAGRDWRVTSGPP